MENQNNNQDCGCEGNCCQPPKKKNSFNKIIFSLIILAALSIVTIKLIGKNNSKQQSNPQSKNVSCTDTTAKKECGKECTSSDGSPCCPKK